MAMNSCNISFVAKWWEEDRWDSALNSTPKLPNYFFYENISFLNISLFRGGLWDLTHVIVKFSAQAQ